MFLSLASHPKAECRGKMEMVEGEDSFVQLAEKVLKDSIFCTVYQATFLSISITPVQNLMACNYKDYSGKAMCSNLYRRI